VARAIQAVADNRAGILLIVEACIEAVQSGNEAVETAVQNSATVAA